MVGLLVLSLFLKGGIMLHLQNSIRVVNPNIGEMGSKYFFKVHFNEFRSFRMFQNQNVQGRPLRLEDWFKRY